MRIIRTAELRNEKGMSQEALAKKSGINRAHIAMLENGHFNPKLETLIKLSQALDCKIEDLIE